jgi:tetratricopeptide (TPR) repeat protein
MLEEIIELHHRGKLAEAEPRYRAWIGDHPQDAEAVHMLAILRRQRRDLDDATRLARRAIELAPDRATYYMTLGALELELRQYHAARADFEAALRLNPNLVNAYAALGQIGLAQGDIEQAGRQYRLALKLGDQRAEVLAGYGNVLLAKGDVDTALKYLTRAVEIEPTDAAAQASLGRAYLARNVPAFAVQALDNALKARPDFHGARILLAEALLMLRDPVRAAAEAQQLKDIRELRSRALLVLGDAARMAGRLDDAAQSYRLVLEAEPANRAAVVALARTEIAQGRVDDGLARFDAYFEMNPADREMRHALAQTGSDMGRSDITRKAYEAALDFDADDATAHQGLALLDEAEGRYESAEAHADRALAAGGREDLGPAILVKSRAEFRRGDYHAAARRLGEMQSRLRQLTRLRDNQLGHARDRLDEPTAALDAWRAAHAAAEAALPPPPAPVAEALVTVWSGLEGRTPHAAGTRGPEALLLGLPGSGIELVAAIIARLDGSVLLADRLGPDPRVDGLAAGEDRYGGQDETEAQLFARKYARTLERIGVPPGLRVVDWIPAFDSRVLLALRETWGRARVIVVDSDPQLALLNWLAVGTMHRWSAADSAAAARWLATAQAHLAMLDQLPGLDVLRVDAQRLLVEPAVVAGEIAAFLGATTVPGMAYEPPRRVGEMPVLLPAARVARYADALAAEFATLAGAG